jgi:hypothetical protein
MYAANQIEDEELKAKLPKPTGYHVLIAVPEMSTKTDGGVIMPDALVKAGRNRVYCRVCTRAGP